MPDVFIFILELLRKRKRAENAKFSKPKKLKLSKLDQGSKKERKTKAHSMKERQVY